jgi:hypothetical protein
MVVTNNLRTAMVAWSRLVELAVRPCNVRVRRLRKTTMTTKDNNRESSKLDIDGLRCALYSSDRSSTS